ncbi:hypothetical protein [Tabrizicola thermarum]|uniref:hypothetical protein n=1 Tax=Tabrizicola thermarum TaxID=2670345 RepID=UPI0012D74B13|nr:hypothetical protein [Tabrizicola thermarum]
MFDLDRLAELDAAIAGLSNPAPDLIRGLKRRPEAPDQVRGGVTAGREGKAA